MTANEKVLLKQMKQAYTSKDGYTLSVEDIEDWDGSPWVGIITDGWGMACALDTLPRKVLGLIAEHIGEIPALDVPIMSGKNRYIEKSLSRCQSSRSAFPPARKSCVERPSRWRGCLCGNLPSHRPLQLSSRRRKI